MDKICFSLLFNHRFDRNVPILRKLYAERFSTLRFLMPFVEWDAEPDVFPVFETSVHFQGYFAQAYERLPQDCDYYVFCGDDLILNPSLDETNLIDSLNCRDAAYVKYLNPICEHSFAWHRFEECVFFPPDDCIIPHASLLPTREELLERYNHHDLPCRNLGPSNFRGAFDKSITWERCKAGLTFILRHGCKPFLPFPLVEGYSDFIVIPRDEWEKFAYYCGVFAAMNLWVDAAVATAMLLACDTIRTEVNHSFSGIELWGDEQLEPEKKYALNFQSMIEDFPAERLYLHPVKLSRWNSTPNQTHPA